MAPQRGDGTKLRELILYIAARMEEDRHAGQGRIKLAKLLWLSDFEAYRRYGRPITGTHYVADELGPSPSEELLATRDLEAAGDLELEAGYERQKLPRAKRPADLAAFSEGELAIIDEMLDRYRTWTGRQLVDLAHEYPGWIHAREGTEIGYHTVHMSIKPVTPHDIERARELAREIP